MASVVGSMVTSGFWKSAGLRSRRAWARVGMVAAAHIRGLRQGRQCRACQAERQHSAGRQNAQSSFHCIFPPLMGCSGRNPVALTLIVCRPRAGGFRPQGRQKQLDNAKLYLYNN